MFSSVPVYAAKDPLVTIVIPTYNRVSLLRQAIESVIRQTHANWELIIVDDGSSDGTITMVTSMQDPRVRFLSLTHSGNIAFLRNAGVRAGSGNWIAFLDSDDLWVRQKLEIQLQLVKGKAARWTYGRFELMNEAGNTIPFRAGNYFPFSGHITRQLLSCEAAVNLGTLLIERNLFNELGGFDTEPKLNCREDYEFVLRLSMQAEALAGDDMLTKVREHPNRTTHKIENGYFLSAYAYKHFIQSQGGSQFGWLAYRQMFNHYWKHILSVCTNGVRNIFTHRKNNTATA